MGQHSVNSFSIGLNLSLVSHKWQSQGRVWIPPSGTIDTWNISWPIASVHVKLICTLATRSPVCRCLTHLPAETMRGNVPQCPHILGREDAILLTIFLMGLNTFYFGHLETGFSILTFLVSYIFYFHCWRFDIAIFWPVYTEYISSWYILYHIFYIDLDLFHFTLKHEKVNLSFLVPMNNSPLPPLTTDAHGEAWAKQESHPSTSLQKEVNYSQAIIFWPSLVCLLLFIPSLSKTPKEKARFSSISTLSSEDLLISLLFVCVCEKDIAIAHDCMCIMCVQGPKEARQRQWDPWNYGYRQLWATNYVGPRKWSWVFCQTSECS